MADLFVHFSPHRCEKTGNPCGTDTWMKGHPCTCVQCQRYLTERADLADVYERANKDIAVALTLREAEAMHLIFDGSLLPIDFNRKDWAPPIMAAPKERAAFVEKLRKLGAKGL